MAEPNQRRRKWTIILLLILIGLAILLPDRNSITSFHETNAAVRLYQLQAIDSYQSLSLEHVLCRWGPRHNSLDLSIDDEARPYPNKAPGVTALALPFYMLLSPGSEEKPPFHWLLNTLALLLSLIPLLIISGFFAFHIEGQLGKGYGLAMVAILLLASPLYTLAGLFQDYALATALFMTGFLLLLRGRQTLTWIAAGFAFGLAGACNYMYFGYGALAVICFLLKRRQSGDSILRAGIPILVGGLGPLLAVLAYHHAIWGDPFTTPYAHLRSAFLRQGPANAEFSALVLLETLFHGKLGILFTTPWTLPGIIGLIWMAKHTATRWTGITACAVVLFNWAFCIYWLGSNPDMGAFNRHMAVSYFFFAWGTVYLLRVVAHDPLWRTWFPPCLVGAVLIAVFYQWVTCWTYPYHSSQITSPIWSVNVSLFIEPLHLKPIHLDRDMRLGTGSIDGNWNWILLSLGLIAAALVLVRVHFVNRETSPRERISRFFIGMVTFLALILWGMSSITVPQGKPGRIPTAAEAMDMRTYEDATINLMGSYTLPDGATWNAQGYSTNRWCQFAICKERTTSDMCDRWVIPKRKRK